jgi:hypothetical protein
MPVGRKWGNCTSWQACLGPVELQRRTYRIDMGRRGRRVSLSQIVTFQNNVPSEAYLRPRRVAEAVKLVKLPIVKRLGMGVRRYIETAHLKGPFQRFR